MRWCIWLRLCATSWKVAGSITHNRSGRNMSVGSNQPLTDLSNINIYWEVKAAGAYG